MKGTGTGWDSCLYRVFIIGGFLTVIASTVVTALTQPPNSKLPIYVGVGAVAVFIVLIVGYWVVRIIFKGYGSLSAPDLTQKSDKNDLSILQNWNTLFSAMVTEGGDPEAMKQSARKGNANLKIWFLWAAVVALCPIAMMVPYAFGLLEWSYIRYGVMFYIAIVIAMSFLSVYVGRTTTKAGEEVLLAPLGLKITALPQVVMMGRDPQVRGASVMEGTRFGRKIKITLDIGPATTSVQYAAPNFVIKNKSGDLEAEMGAPQPVNDVLQELRNARRWEGVEVIGDKDGIRTTRKTKGQNLWLYDLWLIERIINKIEE